MATTTQPQAILVHGIGNRGRIFRKLAHALEAEGVPCVAPDFKPSIAWHGLEPLAVQLAQVVESTASDTIVLMGFSMGTLVCRYYLQHLSAQRRFPLFVSISGPHAGSLWSYLVPGQGAHQMRPGSQFLRDLAPVSELPVERTLSLRSGLDQVIVPPSSSILAGADNRRIDIIGHRFVVSHPQVIGEVLKAVRQAVPMAM